MPATHVIIDNLPGADVTDVITTVAAVTNLIVIVWFFIKGKTDHSSEVQEDRNSKWFRELIIGQKLKDIESFFNKLSEYILSSCFELNKESDRDKQSVIIGQLMDSIGKECEKFRGDFVDLILVFDNDLHRDLRAMTINIEDNVSFELNKLFSGQEVNSRTVNGVAQDARVEFVRRLYNYDMGFGTTLS